MSNNQFQDLLNKMIQSKLPEINALLVRSIRSGGLDPKVNVTSGSQTIGRIGVWPFSVDAVASYNMQNLYGLSSLNINSMGIASVNISPDGAGLFGTIGLQATMSSDLRVHVGGEIRAARYLSVGIGGNATMSSGSINATGDFVATTGDQLCLTSIYVGNARINYGNININIDGLGIFNFLLDPLKNFILGQVKGPIINLIREAVVPPVNNALKDVLPQCIALVK
jgi:hypothetical protein